MKIFVTIAVIFLASNCEATFFGKTGNVQLKGNFHGLAGHPWLGSKQSEAPVAIPEESVDITEAPVIIPETPTENKGHGFSIHSQLQGLLQGHRLFSGSNGGFSLQGNLQGLFKNHQLFAGHFNKNQPATTTEDPFGGDNTGFSVSSPDVAPEIVEGSDAIPISNDAQSSGFSGSFTASAKGGHDIHKIIG